MAPAPARIVKWSTDCVTGKRGYEVRRDAKKVASAMRRQGHHVRPYPCADCDLFHVGHLPRVVLEGEVSATEHYDGAGAPAAAAS
jgi:hypothetical protein